MPYCSRNRLTAICAFFLISCTETSATTRIHVTAKRPDGSTIALAAVRIDGETVGETNAFGTLELSKDLRTDIDHTISVSVDDSNYYYSPHSQSFRVDDRGDNQIAISAVMYLAPKPKRLNSKELENQPTKSTDVQLTTTVSAQEHLTTPMPLIELKARHFKSIKSTANAKTSPADQTLFNVHVYSGHAPIANAEVTWTSPSSSASTCMTNDRGRCVLWKDKSLANAGNLLVRKTGFESNLREILPEDNQNIRFNLKSGFTADMRILGAHPRLDEPAEGVEVILGKDLAATSNKSGFVIAPTRQHSPLNLTIKHQGHEIPIMIPAKSWETELLTLRLPSRKGTFKTEYTAFKVHTPGNQGTNVTADALENILATIKTETSATESEQMTIDLEQLNKGTVGILPILENTGKGMKLSIAMIDTRLGKVISEQLDGVDLSSDGITLAVKRLLSALDERQAKAGVVVGTDQDDLLINIDPKAVKLGDVITLKTRNQTLIGRITKRLNDRISAKFNGISTTEDAWHLMGAQAFTQPKQAGEIAQFQKMLPSLDPRSPELASIDLATKQLAENNPRQALRTLDTVIGGSHLIVILKLHQAAQAHLLLGDTTRAVACLYSAVATAVENDLKVPAFIATVNLNRLKAELMPNLYSEKSLAEALQELQGDNRDLLNELNGLSPELTPIKATLDYSKLLLLQKLAQATADRDTLSTMAKSWDEFEKSLPGHNLSNTDLLGLKQSIVTSRKNYGFNPSSKKVNL
jgi:hypothetical protein